MSYINANRVLPKEVIALIQDYFDGDYLYIPKKETKKAQWGTYTSTKKELAQRNHQIAKEYLNGMGYPDLAKKYFLSEKSIQRIVLTYKESINNRDVG